MFLRSGKKLNSNMDRITEKLGLGQECTLDEIYEKLDALLQADEALRASRRTRTENTELNPPDPLQSLGELKPVIPSFSGDLKEKDAFEFLDELELFRETKNLSELDLLNFVLPRVFVKDARVWYAFKKPFETYQEFRHYFLKEYYSNDYEEEVRNEIHEALQAPQEPISYFVRRMALTYSRLRNPPNAQEQIRDILQKCHPNYRQHLYGKNFTTLRELELECLSVRDKLYSEWKYKQRLGLTSEAQGKSKAVAALQFERRGNNPTACADLGLEALDHARFQRIQSTGHSEKTRHPGVQSGPSNTKTKEIVCFECGTPGHKRPQCRKREERKAANIVNNYSGRKEPLALVYLPGRKTVSLLDSGASHSFLRNDVLNEIKCRRMKRIPCNEVFHMIQGTLISREKVRIPVRIHKHYIMQEFFVLDEMSYEVVLGRDSLSKASITIDIESCTWTKKCKNGFEVTRKFVLPDYRQAANVTVLKNSSINCSSGQPKYRRRSKNWYGHRKNFQIT